jgi:nitrous oxidase accessory protein
VSYDRIRLRLARIGTAVGRGRLHWCRRAILCAALSFVPALGAAAPNDNDLQRRVAEAPPGATLEIPPGVYRTHLRIDKPITLIGRPGAVIDAGGTGDVVRIAASDVALKGFELRHSGRDLTATNAGVFVERKARRVVIADNRLDEILFGIYLDGPSQVKVLDNRITGMAALRSPDRGDGIHLWNDTEVDVGGNDIGQTRDGIYIYVSPNNRIVGNRMHDLRYGIHYMYSNHDVVADNITYRTRAGYALMQSDHLEVRGNRSEADADYGLLLNYVTYSDLQGNVIVGVTGDRGDRGETIVGGEGKGVFVYNSEYNRIHGNTVAQCPIGIHVTAGSEGNRIFANDFVDNRIQVKYVQNAEEDWSWNNVGNYWSDYLGWDLNGDGYGDIAYRPNDGVDILLWKFPTARLLMSSPAVLVLRYIQRAFPVFMPPSVEDSHPLMKPRSSFRRLPDDGRN